MEKLKELFRKMNEYGLPLPMARDPKTNKASVTLTMMIFSFTIVVVGLVSKMSKFVGDIDISQAMYLFGITSGLYLGRKMQSNGKEIKVENETTEGK